MFDARAAKALSAGEHIIVPGAPGLRLVATASTRTWVYRYKSPVDGRMRQVRLGHWPTLGLPGALSAWEKLRVERDAGADPAAEKRQRRAEVAGRLQVAAYTVRRACDDWLASYQGTVAPKTYREAERLLRVELGDLAGKPAADVTRGDAFSLIDGKRHKPVVAGMLRQVLGAVWDRALDAGELPDSAPNWWRLILRGKLPSKGKVVEGKNIGPVKRVLSEAEVGQLLRWLPNYSRDMTDLLTLYLWTCCRGAELVAMARAEITDEPDGLWWTIPRERLKMRRNPLTTDLRVPLVGRAEAIVRRRLEASTAPWLFPSRGRSGHIEQKAIGVAVWVHMPRCESQPGWLRPRLQMAEWAPHDLRRTGRTLLASLGCPAEVAEAILGHQAPSIQATYNRHSYDAERRHWITLLSVRLEQLAGQAPA
jgi:integrase